jgi:hypothetical protein
MAWPKPKPKTLIKYSAFTALGLVAYFLYTNDHEPPVLTGFSFEADSQEVGEYVFSGAISDERGVAKAAFSCLDGDQVRMVIDVAMSGSNRNQVSFGLISKSPHWAGNWSGTSYELEFRGQTNLGEQGPSCIWQAELKDSLGNTKTEVLK